MSKRERDENEDGGGEEKRMKINEELDFLEMLETLKKMKENLKKVKEFLQSEFEKKCPVEKRREGETHLHYAAFLGHVEATKVLLGNGAEVNAVDEDKRVPLHLAAQEGHVDVAKVFIHNGADVNAVKENKLTALHLAAQEGHVDVAKVLLQNGAEVNAVDEHK